MHTPPYANLFCPEDPWDKKALHTGKYAFGTTSHVKQKQVDRSPPLTANEFQAFIVFMISR